MIDQQQVHVRVRNRGVGVGGLFDVEAQGAVRGDEMDVGALGSSAVGVIVAEELGSLYYENKFPPPTGRSNPAQLFPDS